jgi:hypothetical protein
MLRALARGKPDRLPATVHQWQKFHLDAYQDGITDLEAFEMFGLDASIQFFQDMGQFWLTDADFTKFSTPDWRDEVEVLSSDPDNRICRHTIRTPGGTLTYASAGNRAMVFKLFETVGPDGGYILSASDHFFDTPPGNLRVYAEAARECVY